MEMTNIWRKIYGYCDWYFWRDDYTEKIVIQEWTTRIVTIDNFENISFCKFDTEEDKELKLREWSNNIL